MDAIALLVALLIAVTLVMLPFEATEPRQKASLEHLALTYFQALLIALLSISLSLLLALFVFCLILLGPAYALGDIIALPWLTAIPALIAGFWTARQASRKIVAHEFNRLKHC